MTCIKPLSLLLAAILAASTMAIRWTWNDLRNSELQLHGRAGKHLIYVNTDPTMCRLKGFYYDLRTLHCYKIQSLAEETYVEFDDFDPSDPDDTTCYNLGGGNVEGEHGYHFKRDPYLDFDMENQIENNLIPSPPHTNEPIANAANGDMEIYQTANSLFGYRELKFRANGLYLLRLMFALVEEDDREKTRTFSIHISGYDDKLTIKDKINIFEAAGFYKAYDFFTTIRFRNQSHLIFEESLAKRVNTWANAAQLHFEPGSYYKDLMNGYCLTRFHSCNKFCHDPEKCKARGCIYDLKNSHCIEDFDEEAICKSYSHNKTLCTQHGCNYCCETSICSMEANSNCMDTDCGRYCMDEKMCLKNKEESCSYNSEEGTCVDRTPIPKLQVAFVINAGVDPKLVKEKNSTKAFKGASVGMSEEIKKMYGDPEFAVTTFADWDVFVDNHDDKEGCYQLLQEMTTDTAKIKQVKIKELLSIGKSNGPTALAWTAADSRVGWKSGKFLETKSGPKRPLVRVMILFDLREFYEPIITFTGTDEDYEGAWKNRMESLLSGTNMCLLNKQPYLESVYTALTLHDVSVLGSFDIENGKYYEENFGHKYLTYLKASREDINDIMDLFNKHVAERANPRREIEKEKLCKSISDKTSCLLSGCSFCCETSTCTAEPSCDCMDTGCSRHCLQKGKCLLNKIPNECFYNSKLDRCGDVVDLPPNPKLQIAFVVNSGYNKDTSSTSISVFKEIVEAIDEIKQLYDDPQFALTTFADCENSVYGTKQGHNDIEGCNKLVKTFTTDTETIKGASITPLLTPLPESNGPTALQWTCSDTRLGWKEGDSFEERPLIRLLILIDHQEFHEPTNAVEAVNQKNRKWGNRRESFDGTNMCQLNKQPHLDFIYNVLTSHEVFVLALLTPENFKYYDDNFKHDNIEKYDEGYVSYNNFLKFFNRGVAALTLQVTTQDYVKEQGCQSLGNEKALCLKHDCFFCCATATCTEENSDCSDTECGAYCFEEKKCLKNRSPHTCAYNYEQESCFDCPVIPKLQVAVVVDAAYSNLSNKYVGSRYTFEALLKHIDRFTKIYGDPEFALTSFADWDNSVWKPIPKMTTTTTRRTTTTHKFKLRFKPRKYGRKRRSLTLPNGDISHKDKDGCYKLVQTMTKNIEAIKTAKIMYLNRARENNGPTALSWTASDPTLGWKDTKLFEAEDELKRPLVKLMIIIDHIGFNADDVHPEENKADWGNRKMSVDGMNTCKDNRRPELNELYKVLAKHDVIVFGILSRHAFSFYNDKFKYSMYQAIDEDNEYMTVDDFSKQLNEFVAKKAHKDISPACLNYDLLK